MAAARGGEISTDPEQIDLDRVRYLVFSVRWLVDKIQNQYVINPGQYTLSVYLVCVCSPPDGVTTLSATRGTRAYRLRSRGLWVGIAVISYPHTGDRRTDGRTDRQTQVTSNRLIIPRSNFK